MLSSKQIKALQALLTHPTIKEAAKAAGVHERTVREYLKQDEFKTAYASECKQLLDGATRQAQQALSPAINALREIALDTEESAQARVSAARSLLEYGLRMTEITDILALVDEG